MLDNLKPAPAINPVVLLVCTAAISVAATLQFAAPRQNIDVVCAGPVAGWKQVAEQWEDTSRKWNELSDRFEKVANDALKSAERWRQIAEGTRL